jgi:hypothetical protein
MTLVADNLESGITGLSSAQSTRAGVILSRQRLFTGGGNQTWTGFLPYDTVGVNASVYIMSQGSAATSDAMTITTSAGGTTLLTFSQMGSATGILSGTTTGLGVKTAVASACFRPAPVSNPEGSDIPFRVILSSVDVATEYGLALTFRRRFKPGT